MKNSKKKVEPVRSAFYKLDPSKPIAAEGKNYIFSKILLALAVFFCAVGAFIIITNVKSDDYESNKQTFVILIAIIGAFLAGAIALNVGIAVHKSRLRNRILSADVTYATITSVSVTEHTTRDSDGDTHTKEEVFLSYSFYDRNGNIRSEHYSKTYGRAPEFYEGQQIVVAFDDDMCFILSKYTLLDGDSTSYDILTSDSLTENRPSDNKQNFSGETVDIDVNQYVPFGYSKVYYLLAGIYGAFALAFASLLTFYAITVKDVYVWAYVGMFGLLFAVFFILALKSALIPYKVKCNYDNIVSVGAFYTRGKLESTNKIYGNGARGKYFCVYADINGNERRFYVGAFMAKELLRRGNTDVIIAYSQDKAVALVEKSDIKI